MDTPRALVVHIGLHKTGSTSIQVSLQQSRSRLLREHGVLYPEVGCVEYPGHANLAWQATADRRWRQQDGDAETLVAEIDRLRPDTVLLSAEDFSLDGASDQVIHWIDDVAKAVGIDSVRIVAYVRPQWEYLESVYIESIKYGTVGPDFDAFLEQSVGLRRFDYAWLFRPWRDRFGEDLHVRLYRTREPDGWDAVTDFWRAVPDLPDDPLASPGERNHRMGATTAGMLLELRARLQSGNATDDDALPDLLKRARRRIERQLRDQEAYRPLSSAQAAAIASTWREANREFVAEYLPTDRECSLVTPPHVDDLRRTAAWSLQRSRRRERRAFRRLLTSLGV